MENPNLVKPTYSIIMLIYHRNKELVDMALDCVASIKIHSEDYELIIVDNGSTERYEWDKICNTYIRFDKNMGISRGWNAGLLMSRGKYKVIVGDDILARKGWLEGMKKAMDMPLAGMVNPYVQHLPQGVGIVETYKWPSGACFMVTQSTINRVGYFDQDTYYPCNFEDHDYWTRLLKAGLKIYVNYDCFVMHKEGQTVHAEDLSKHFYEMKHKFVNKHGFDNQEIFCGSKPFPFN